MQDWFLVAIGGSAGACSRFAVASCFENRSQFPLATLLVNLMGCFLIGLMAGVGWMAPENPRRFFLAVGFLGSFTTFSAFGYETWRMIEQNRFLAIGANVGLNVIAGIALVAVGLWLGKSLSSPNLTEI
jgi:fluoride exporter